MRFLITLLALAVLSAPAYAESAYERVIRSGELKCGFMAWPPFFDVDPNTGNVMGFNREVIDEIGKFLNLKITYTQIQVGEQVEELKQGRVDAICGDGPWLLSTIKFLDYSHPYYYQGAYVFAQADEKQIKAWNDLNNPGITFIGMDGDVSSDLVPRRFSHAKLRTLGSSADTAQMLTEVATRKADVMLTDMPSGTRFIQSNPGKIRLLFKTPVAVQGGGFSVKKGESDLLNMLNGAVDAALNNGLVDDILKKYDPTGTQFLKVAVPYR